MSTPQNPLMQQAAGMFANPNAAAVPQPQQGVIDPQKHHVIAAIIQALSQGFQNYGMTAMDPRERLQRQEMDAQKAEAMARLGAQQEQLGMEHQRVGFEGQRTAADVARSGAETKLAGVRAEEEPKRTAIEKQRATTEQQRTDQAYEMEKKRLAQEAIKVNAEYGPHGLRSQEVGIQGSRAASEAKLADIADKRLKLERETNEAAMQRAGLGTDLKAIEDARQREIDGVKEIYGKNPWYERRSTTLDKYNEQLKGINAYYDAKLAAAEKAAGTGAASGTGAAPQAPTGGNQGPAPQGQGTRPAYQKDGKWYDAQTNNPL